MEVRIIKKEIRKKELLNIAYKLFMTKGYENTSVDEIIAEAKIAKGTYYYYFESKEATLEKVIEMMIEEECKKANEILQSNLSVQEKILGIIISMRPNTEELKIQEAINIPENIVMHQKINKKIIEVITPLLTEVIEEGKKQNIFDCDNVKERIEIILIITNNLFDANEQNSRKLNIYIEIFIDLIEKLLGAKKGTIDFAKKLINKGDL